jgi:hypothetical protein
MVLPTKERGIKMAKKKGKIKSYGIFDRLTNNRVFVVRATRVEQDYQNKMCRFYFAKTVIATISTSKHYVYELL